MGYDPDKYWNERVHPNKNGSLPERVQELLSDYVAGAGSILDAGCGAGRGFEYYPPDAEVTGIDFVDTYQDQITKKASSYEGSFVSFRHDLREPLPFHDGRFTHCLAVKVLMHIPDPEPTIEELARACDSVFICDTWDEDERAKHVTIHDYQKLLDDYIINWYEKIGSHLVIVYSKP